MDPKLIMVFVAGICIAVGLYNIFKGVAKKKRCTGKVNGKIVDINATRSSSENGGTEYRPIVSFSYEGKEYMGEIGVVTKSKRAYKVGDEQVIIFNPENPNEFMSIKVNAQLKAGIIFIVIGIFFAFLVPYVS